MADGMRQAAGRATLGLFLACALPTQAADMADPMRPPSGFGEPAAAAAREAPMRVSGVFLMSKQPYAIIDGQVARVGDRLEAGRIGKIDATGVWLKTATGLRQLKLLPDVAKTPSGKGKIKVEKR